METTSTPFNATILNEKTKSWLSDLLFIKDEHKFLLDATNETTLEITNDDTQIEREEIIDAINRSEKRNCMLINTVENHLECLDNCILDSTSKTKEEFVDKHLLLQAKVTKNIATFKRLKKQLFEIIKKAKKHEKLEYLLDSKLSLLN
ncbi:hypothetical protein [Winogradskyella jejuensis]|uniref:Uncharacterized protein n=1 Tax=Winogradskyella jejuensis TaxID=1089305 RepID=A0A1M5NRF8_9FLAO|nr:hypothetical protein [Winogradskyella jejuensis]SHG92090.1 hypothetical protein SAMN05444148_1277 [Winogradskyella jejuensis]